MLSARDIVDAKVREAQWYMMRLYKYFSLLVNYENETPQEKNPR